MDLEMQKWIESRYPDYLSAVGNCAQAVHAMQKDFPKLRITNGEVDALGYPEPRLHWWLVGEDGEIVDPTAAQFQQGVFCYREIDESHPARNYPQERCPNCGEHFYADEQHAGYSPLCSSECARDYAAYCSNPL